LRKGDAGIVVGDDGAGWIVVNHAILGGAEAAGFWVAQRFTAAITGVVFSTGFKPPRSKLLHRKYFFPQAATD
jgi:hypothetical protein